MRLILKGKLLSSTKSKFEVICVQSHFHKMKKEVFFPNRHTKCWRTQTKKKSSRVKAHLKQFLNGVMNQKS